MKFRTERQKEKSSFSAKILVKFNSCLTFWMLIHGKEKLQKAWTLTFYHLSCWKWCRPGTLDLQDSFPSPKVQQICQNFDEPDLPIGGRWHIFCNKVVKNRVWLWTMNLEMQPGEVFSKPSRAPLESLLSNYIPDGLICYLPLHFPYLSKISKYNVLSPSADQVNWNEKKVPEA